MGGRGRPTARHLARDKAPEQLPIKPQYRGRAILGGIVGGAGAAMLLQQYGVFALSAIALLAGIFFGVALGIGVPSAAYIFVARTHNDRLREEAASRQHALGAATVSTVLIVAAIATVTSLAFASPASATMDGHCTARIGDEAAGQLEATKADALTLDPDEKLPMTVRSGAPITGATLTSTYGGRKFTLLEVTRKVDKVKEPRRLKFAFWPKDAAWQGAGLHKYHLQVDLAKGGRCEIEFMGNIDRSPLSTTTGRVAAIFVVLGLYGIVRSAIRVSRNVVPSRDELRDAFDELEILRKRTGIGHGVRPALESLAAMAPIPEAPENFAGPWPDQSADDNAVGTADVGGRSYWWKKDGEDGEDAEGQPAVAMPAIVAAPAAKRSAGKARPARAVPDAAKSAAPPAPAAFKGPVGPAIGGAQRFRMGDAGAPGWRNGSPAGGTPSDPAATPDSEVDALNGAVDEISDVNETVEVQPSETSATTEVDATTEVGVAPDTEVEVAAVEVAAVEVAAVEVAAVEVAAVDAPVAPDLAGSSDELEAAAEEVVAKPARGRQLWWAASDAPDADAAPAVDAVEDAAPHPVEVEAADTAADAEGAAPSADTEQAWFVTVVTSPTVDETVASTAEPEAAEPTPEVASAAVGPDVEVVPEPAATEPAATEPAAKRSRWFRSATPNEAPPDAPVADAAPEPAPEVEAVAEVATAPETEVEVEVAPETAVEVAAAPEPTPSDNTSDAASQLAVTVDAFAALAKPPDEDPVTHREAEETRGESEAKRGRWRRRPKREGGGSDTAPGRLPEPDATLAPGRDASETELNPALSAALSGYVKPGFEPKPVAPERLEAERLEAERVEAERLEAERLEAAARESEARVTEARVAAARESEARVTEARVAAARESEARVAEARVAAREAERVEAERVEAERVEAERVEAERVEAERLEAERVEAERLEAERLEAERLEAERLEAERLEAERLEAERLEAERLEAERVEAERLEAERLEAERLEAERLEAERLEAERLEAERLEAERLEAERLEAERLEAERLEAERLEAEERVTEARVAAAREAEERVTEARVAAAREAEERVTEARVAEAWEANPPVSATADAEGELPSVSQLVSELAASVAEPDEPAGVTWEPADLADTRNALATDPGGAGVLGPVAFSANLEVGTRSRDAYNRWTESSAAERALPELEQQLQDILAALPISGEARGRLSAAIDRSALRSAAEDWVAKVGQPPDLLVQAAVWRHRDQSSILSGLLAPGSSLVDVAHRAALPDLSDHDWDLLTQEVSWPWA